MYIAPRPLTADDPLFAVRLALAPVICLGLAVLLQTPIPALLASLPMGLLAGQRKAFNPQKLLFGPLVMAAAIVLMDVLVTVTRPMPLVLLTLLFATFFGAYFLILRTGNPLGMLILIAAVLMSTMGMFSLQAMDMLRDCFLQACLCALLLNPLLYALLPPRTTELFVEDFQPAVGGEYVKRALIRSAVMLLLTLWLYTILDIANVVYAIVAVFVTVFPTRRLLYRELRERIFATLLGGAAALLLLGLFVFSAHLPVLLLLLLLAGLVFGQQMLTGRYPPAVYQFAFSSMLALVVGSLSSSAPWDATLLRIGLTIVGALSAAVLTSLLELILLRPETLEHTNPRVLTTATRAR